MPNCLELKRLLLKVNNQTTPSLMMRSKTLKGQKSKTTESAKRRGKQLSKKKKKRSQAINNQQETTTIVQKMIYFERSEIGFPELI